jgi:hypothetical protein
MKSLEAQYCELKEKIVAAEVAKGFSEAAVETTIKEAVKGETIEERLGRLQKHAKKLNVVTESGRPARVERKNGTAINEAAKEDRVERAMRIHRLSFRASSIFCGLPDPGPSAKTPAAFIEARAARWKKANKWISEADAKTLAEKGIEP